MGRIRLGPAAGYPNMTCVFNGDFEEDPSGNRFDWRITPREGVATAFDVAILRSGARALRVQFDGKQNVRDVGIEQFTFLRRAGINFVRT